MEIVNDENTGHKEPNSGEKQKVNVDISSAEEVVCESCSGKIFQEKMMIRKLSKFMTGSDRDSIVPIPVIVCADCNHINEMFKPQV